MAVKKSVGKELMCGTDVELITSVSCGYDVELSYIEVENFYIKNEGGSNIEVAINGGEPLVLEPEDTLDLSRSTNVFSCICTTGGYLRWGGMA